jgi:hypothetical protein
MNDDSQAFRGRGRGKRWAKVAHGLYIPARDIGRPHDDLLAWRLVLPSSGAFTHLTAAREYGWWLPPLPDDVPVFISIDEHDSRPQRPGLRVARHPACTPADVQALAAGRRRGAPMLRRAIRLADGRSESAWESMLRMLHIACHIPVEPQFEVYDGQGLFVARGDLRIKGTTTLHEYDGDEHLKRHRQRKDLGRQRRIGHVNWTRRAYTSHEVLKQAVSILRDADASLGRPHRPERVRHWHALLAGSLFTPSGTERLRARWGMPPTEGEDRQARGA